MSVLEVDDLIDEPRCDPEHRIPRLDFELNHGCDHACAHCYNIWNAPDGVAGAGYPKGSLSTADFSAMIEKAIRHSGATHVTITGGEPLLRKDALELLAVAGRWAKTVHLITNGSHVDPATARGLKAARVGSVQLTLLSAKREKHDRLKGAVCFDDTLRAALNLRDAGVPVQVCFVAMKENWTDFEAVMELGCAIGVRAISYNRMSPTGWAVEHLDRLLPLIDQVEHNLDTAERLGPKLGVKVGTAMPVPPCLIRLERYQWVRFGFCSVDSASPNIVIDPVGNVRSCNLASGIMGNIRVQDWPEIHAHPYQREFHRIVPEPCRGCAYERSCQGGCKESALATYGSLEHPEPFVHLARTGSLDAASAASAASTAPLVQVADPRR